MNYSSYQNVYFNNNMSNLKSDSPSIYYEYFPYDYDSNVSSMQRDGRPDGRRPDGRPDDRRPGGRPDGRRPGGRPDREPERRPSFPMHNPQGMPLSPPPSFIPNKQASVFRVDSSSIRGCLFRFTYVWTDRGDEFWMFPIQVSRSTVAGFRWNRRFGWSYFGISLDRIDAFMCN